MAASSPVLSPSTATSCCAAMGSMRRLRRSKHCMVKLSFASAFFEVGYGFFDGSGFGELVDESFAFDAAFVLADDDAGFGWIVDGLLAVGDHGFAEFVVGVLQVGYDDD